MKNWWIIGLTALLATASSASAALFYDDLEDQSLENWTVADNPISAPDGFWEVEQEPGNTDIEVINDPTGSNHGKIIRLYDNDSNGGYQNPRLQAHIGFNWMPAIVSYDVYFPTELGGARNRIYTLDDGFVSEIRWETDGKIKVRVAPDVLTTDVGAYSANTWYNVWQKFSADSYNLVITQEGVGTIVDWTDTTLSNQPTFEYIRFMGITDTSTGVYYLDNIVIPEPTTAAVVCIGLAGLCLFRGKRTED